MKHLIPLSSLVVCAALMSGCASVGNESLRNVSEQSVKQQIVEGKSTKADVRAMYGSPVKTSFTDSGLEIWNYEFSKVTADAVSFIPSSTCSAALPAAPRRSSSFCLTIKASSSATP